MDDGEKGQGRGGGILQSVAALEGRPQVGFEDLLANHQQLDIGRVAPLSEEETVVESLQDIARQQAACFPSLSTVYSLGDSLGALSLDNVLARATVDEEDDSGLLPSLVKSTTGWSLESTDVSLAPLAITDTFDEEELQLLSTFATVDVDREEELQLGGESEGESEGSNSLASFSCSSLPSLSSTDSLAEIRDIIWDRLCVGNAFSSSLQNLDLSGPSSSSSPFATTPPPPCPHKYDSDLIFDENIASTEKHSSARVLDGSQGGESYQKCDVAEKQDDALVDQALLDNIAGFTLNERLPSLLTTFESGEDRERPTDTETDTDSNEDTNVGDDDEQSTTVTKDLLPLQNSSSSCAELEQLDLELSLLHLSHPSSPSSEQHFNFVQEDIDSFDDDDDEEEHQHCCNRPLLSKISVETSVEPDLLLIRPQGKPLAALNTLRAAAQLKLTAISATESSLVGDTLQIVQEDCDDEEVQHTMEANNNDSKMEGSHREERNDQLEINSNNCHVVSSSQNVSDTLNGPVESPQCGASCVTRKDVAKAAKAYTGSFGVPLNDGIQAENTQKSSSLRKGKNEKTCIGHKEAVFGLSFSPEGQYLATASQDSTIKVWDVNSNKCVATLVGHDREYECLRVTWAPIGWGRSFLNDKTQDDNGPAKISRDFVLASGSANGIVKLWQPLASQSPNSSCLFTIDHCCADGDGERLDIKDEDIPQIYSLQFIKRWVDLRDDGNENESNCLLTSCDDCIYLWEIQENGKEPKITRQDKDDVRKAKLRMNNFLILKFVNMNQGRYGVLIHFPAQGTSPGEKRKQISFTSAKDDSKSLNLDLDDERFGGDRNPENKSFVFDSSHCPANGLLAVALSDGTARVVNGRGVCVAVLSLPGCKSHLTAVAWDMPGNRLATCVATGHLVLWKIDFCDWKGKVVPSCSSVLADNSSPSRPLFGAKFCGGEKQELILSWGIDGHLRLWDAFLEGETNAPLSSLVCREDYPVYAVDESSSCNESNNKVVSTIAVGGGRDAGFLGVPVYLYHIHHT